MSTFTRRGLAPATACLLFLLTGMDAAASAPDYPSKPVRFVVPAAAGGGTDIIARMVATRLADALGQGVVVDNRAGGSHTIGTELVAIAPRDGYTLLFATNSLATHVTLYPKLPYHLVRDFAPVTLAAASPNLLAVHPSLPVQSVGELITLARQKPGQLNYGSSGNGGTGHLAMEMLKTMTSVNLVHIPYRSGGPALNALIAGEVSVLFGNIVAAVPQARAGRIRALGVTSRNRLVALPDIPTVAEAGVPGFEAIAWFGIFAPVGTPAAIVERLSTEIARIVKLPAVAERLKAEGAEPVGNRPHEFREFVRADIEKWARVIRSARITVDQ